jgi:4'-phosphopantetheinyl transferase
MTFCTSPPTDSRLDSDVTGSCLTLGLVHLWWADLARDEPEIGRFHDLISPAERDRAARFRAGDSRRRFVTSRGILRTLLGSYLAEDPAEVPLTVGCFGKPRLAGKRPILYFNVSHADDLAVYAFAGECEVGVDIERIQEVAEWQAIATSLFTEPETAALNALAGTERTSAFIGAWTRHEAMLKAPGRGLGGLRPADSATFSFCPIKPPPGFAAALAIEGPPAIVFDAGFL